MMFVRYGATPLGYDTGFYWQYFNLITNLGRIGEAIGTNHIAYISWFPFFFFGLSAVPTINFLHITHQLLTFSALYFVLRSLPLKKYSMPVCVAGLFLMAISINQFMAFWWMFYKQSMAIPFLLLALGLFLRRSWWTIPVVAFGAAIHLQPAIPFIIALTIYLIYQIFGSIIRKKPIDKEILYIGLGGILAAGLLFLIKGPQDIKGHIDYFMHFKGMATGGYSWEIQQAKGLFLPFSTFGLNAIFYLPFALIGLLKSPSWLLRNNHHKFLVVIFITIISIILSLFPFLYQNRSLILLDIFIIIFAAYPLVLFIQHSLREGWSGKFILVLFFAGSIIFSSRVIWNNQPQIYPDEIAELKTLQNIRNKNDDYVMATSSIYTPWVFAYNNFEPTIAPGWLYWDKWNFPMWSEFWYGSNNQRKNELLQLYDNKTIYLFIGKRQNIHPNLKNFLDTDKHFQQISSHIWRYSP
ncbi:MAG: hypothetical protein Q8M83_01750 [bacterium]|nr:hypothetical protein [bacterium]